MKIIDENNLIPDKNILIKIIKEHPLCKNLNDRIRNLTIKLSNECRIGLNKNQDVTLFLTKNVSSQKNYEYILYHEFSHTCDKLNPEFKYTDKKRDALADIEKLKVMEIWNVYIDSRLDKLDLFRLKDEGYSLINGKLQMLPRNIKSYLMCRVNLLQTGEIGEINDAKIIIEDIWKNPTKFLSYDDMIDIVKLNL